MAGRIGYGVTLGIDITTPGTFVPVVDLTNISFPAQAVSDVDVTSTTQATPYKQFLPGLRDGGSITLEALWSGTAYAALVALLGAAHQFQVTVGTVTYTWSGYVSKVGEMSVEPDGSMKFKVEGRVLTAVTVGATS